MSKVVNMDDVKSGINAGRVIVVGIVVIAVTLAIGVYIVQTLNNTSGGVLGSAVTLLNNTVGPISGGVQFLALAFLVVVAVIIIKVIQAAGE